MKVRVRVRVSNGIHLVEAHISRAGDRVDEAAHLARVGVSVIGLGLGLGLRLGFRVGVSTRGRARCAA